MIPLEEIPAGTSVRASYQGRIVYFSILAYRICNCTCEAGSNSHDSLHREGELEETVNGNEMTWAYKKGLQGHSAPESFTIIFSFPDGCHQSLRAFPHSTEHLRSCCYVQVTRTGSVQIKMQRKILSGKVSLGQEEEKLFLSFLCDLKLIPKAAEKMKKKPKQTMRASEGFPVI